MLIRYAKIQNENVGGPDLTNQETKSAKLTRKTRQNR
jgi:hypothetical protein